MPKLSPHEPEISKQHTKGKTIYSKIIARSYSKDNWEVTIIDCCCPELALPVCVCVGGDTLSAYGSFVQQ